MKTLLKLTPVIGAVALLAACGQTMEQRAATGALGHVAARGDPAHAVSLAIGGSAFIVTAPRDERQHRHHVHTTAHRVLPE